VLRSLLFGFSLGRHMGEMLHHRVCVNLAYGTDFTLQLECALQFGFSFTDAFQFELAFTLQLKLAFALTLTPGAGLQFALEFLQFLFVCGRHIVLLFGRAVLLVSSARPGFPMLGLSGHGACRSAAQRAG
jgi:hypothetical protein